MRMVRTPSSAHLPVARLFGATIRRSFLGRCARGRSRDFGKMQAGNTRALHRARPLRLQVPFAFPLTARVCAGCPLLRCLGRATRHGLRGTRGAARMRLSRTTAVSRVFTSRYRPLGRTFRNMHGPICRLATAIGGRSGRSRRVARIARRGRNRDARTLRTSRSIFMCAGVCGWGWTTAFSIMYRRTACIRVSVTTRAGPPRRLRIINYAISASAARGATFPLCPCALVVSPCATGIPPHALIIHPVHRFVHLP